MRIKAWEDHMAMNVDPDIAFLVHLDFKARVSVTLDLMKLISPTYERYTRL